MLIDVTLAAVPGLPVPADPGLLARALAASWRAGPAALQLSDEPEEVEIDDEEDEDEDDEDLDDEDLDEEDDEDEDDDDEDDDEEVIEGEEEEA